MTAHVLAFSRRSLLSRVSIALLGLGFAFASCAQEQKVIRLATTTSTYHSGLLDYLLPEFKTQSGIEVQVLATGTGKALKMGENGDVDVVITHAPQAEADFVKQGYGIEPRSLMYNDFILVGPIADPAHVAKTTTLTQALNAIATTKQRFISRGDDSGTHKKELALWQQANIEPTFAGYKSVGQGMGPTLTMANELQAYTLTDRGTWLAYKNKLDLALIAQGYTELFNPYQVILINPARYPDLNHNGAKKFSDWLITPQAQQMINEFKINGEPLFVATAG